MPNWCTGEGGCDCIRCRESRGPIYAPDCSECAARQAADEREAAEAAATAKRKRNRQHAPKTLQCPDCNANMRIVQDKFWGCSGYPYCRRTLPLAVNPELQCPACGEPMVRRDGRNGPFWGCSTYPNCTGTRDIDALPHNYRKICDEIDPDPFNTLADWDEFRPDFD